MKDFFSSLKNRNKLLYIAGWFFFAAFLFCLALSFFDERSINGVNVWHKPIKFHLSVWIYLWTLAYIMPLFYRKAQRFFSVATTILMVIEIGLICFQAYRGVASHFNNSTAFDGMVFAVMGVIILLNTILLMVMTLLLFIKPTSFSSFRTATLWGLILTLISSFIGYIMVNYLNHSTVNDLAEKGIYILNWKLKSGDIRISHFVGIHGFQAILFLNYQLEKRNWPRYWLHLFGTAYLILVYLLYYWAV